MILKLVTLVSFIFMITMNYLANTLPFGGNTTGDISRKYDTMFTPSGFTFSIWGLIYILLSIFVVLIFVSPTLVIPEQNTHILVLFIVVNFLNGTWLLVWHNDLQLLSTVVIIGMLVCLLILMLSIDKSYSLTYITFSIYAGWISIATIANISIVLYKVNIGLFMNHESFWFYTILIVGVVISIVSFIKTKNLAYVSVYGWAYFGILMKYL